MAPEVTASPPKASSPPSNGMQQPDGLEQQRARRSRTPSPEISDVGPNAFIVDDTDGE